MSIGKRIKKLRVEHDLLQADLGKIIGVSDKAVSAWERDQKIPRMGAVEKMAAYFHVSKSFIVYGTEEKPDDKGAEQSGMMDISDEVLSIAKQIAALPASKRQAVVQLIGLLLSEDSNNTGERG